jgi:hypothetical protein
VFRIPLNDDYMTDLMFVFSACNLGRRLTHNPSGNPPYAAPLHGTHAFGHLPPASFEVFLNRFGGGDLQRRKTWFNPSGRPSLPTPGEHQARCDTVATHNFSHAAPTRPKPPPASPDDLKAGLKVTRFAEDFFAQLTLLLTSNALDVLRVP